MLALLLLMQVEDPLIRAARAKTSAERRCEVNASSTDITVCGLRTADRFRVPLATHTPSRVDDVTGGRAAMLHARTPMEQMGPFLVGGGMAGVRAGVGFGPGQGSGSTSVGGLRQPAP